MRQSIVLILGVLALVHARASEAIFEAIRNNDLDEVKRIIHADPRPAARATRSFM